MDKSLGAILSLGWQSIAYGLGTIGSRIVVYFLLPFLTRSMLREEFGAVSVLNTAYTFINMLTFAGLGAATLKFYYEYKEEEDRRLVLGSSQFLNFILAAIPSIFIIVFPEPVSHFLFGSEAYTSAIQYTAGLLVIDTMNIYGGMILRLQVRPLVSSIHATLSIACEAGLAVILVTVYQMGVTGYWLGYMLGSIMGLLYMIWLVRKSLVFKVSWEKGVELLKFGIPLIPAGLSLTALRLADRYIIGSISGLEQVAVYDVGYRIGVVVSLLIEPFRAAWQPFAFSMADKPEAQKIFRDVLTYFTAALVFLALGVTAFRTELIQIMAPVSYTGAEQVIGWVAASQVFLGIYMILSTGSMIRNKTRLLAWAGIAAAILNILLNYLFIPSMGILAAAIATFVSYLALAIIAYIIIRIWFATLIDWERMAKLLLVCGAISLILLALETFSLDHWLILTIKILALLLFPAFLFLTRFINVEQGKELLGLVRERLFGKAKV